MKIGIIGALGRMGRAIGTKVLESKSLTLAAVCVRQGHEHVSTDYGSALGLAACGVLITDDCHRVFAASDVVIDFSTAANLPNVLKACLQTPRPYLCGVTGFENTHIPAALCKDTAMKAAIFYAPNVSKGVSVLERLVDQTAKGLPDTYHIEIVEHHHYAKKDIPSGTALALAACAAKARNLDLSYIYKAQDRISLNPRSPQAIYMSSVRGGGIAGYHEVHFISNEDQITLSHRAFSHHLFAQSALDIAPWLYQQKPGYYGMKEI